MKAKVTAAAVLAAGVALFFALGGYTWMTGEGNVEELLTETGVVGPLIFIFVMWATQPLGVPGFVYMVPAGLVWPYPLAICLAWIGNMGASYLAFAFARWFARDWVKARIPPRMHRFDDRLEEGGIWPIVLIRLVLGQLPAADWLLGVTKVSNRTFAIGTAIGIIPGIIVFVVAGGGLFEAVSGMPPTTRRLVIGALVGFAVGRRLIARRAKRRVEAEMALGAPADPVAEAPKGDPAA